MRIRTPQRELRGCCECVCGCANHLLNLFVANAIVRHRTNLTMRVRNHQHATLFKLVKELFATRCATLNLEEDKVSHHAGGIKAVANRLRNVTWLDHSLHFSKFFREDSVVCVVFGYSFNRPLWAV